MPGSKSASEPGAWVSLSLEESGGFAGLRRGTQLVRKELEPRLAARIDALLARVKPGTRSAAAPRSTHMPDAQTLSLEVLTAKGSWRAAFDTADLPEGVAALVGASPRMKPLPPA